MKIITSKIKGVSVGGRPIFNNSLETVAIIDGNNFCIRAFYACGTKKTPEAFISNTFRMLTNLLIKHRVGLLLFVFDGGKTWRSELHKSNRSWKSKKGILGYKGGRSIYASEDYAIIKHYIEVFRKFVLNDLTIPNFTVEGVEADDVIFWIAKNLVGVNKLIVSSDEDLVQSCKHPNTVWFSPGKNEYLHKNKFEECNGYPLDKYVPLKAILGDTSDNIEGIYGLSEKTLHKWYMRSGVFPFDIFAWLREYGSYSEQITYLTKDYINNYEVSKKLIDAEIFASIWEGLDIKRFYGAIFYQSSIEYKTIYKIVSSTGINNIPPSGIHSLVDTLAVCSRTVNKLRRNKIWA